MWDIIFEITRGVVILAILLFVLRADRKVQYERRGWNYIKFGFWLLLFGSVVDITDNYDSLNFTMLLGDTPGQAFLEKVVGYLGGFSFLALGLWLWLPAVQRVGDMEKQLRAAMERTRFVFDNSPIGMVRGNLATLDVVRNKAFASMLGYDSPEEIQEISFAQGGPSFLWQDSSHSKDIKTRLKAESVIQNHEALFRRKDGSDVWLLLDYVNASGMNPDSDGDESFIYCFARDITAEKQAKKALAESEQRLQTIINMMPVGVYLVELPSRTVVQANPACMEMLGRSEEEVVGSHCCDVLCPNKEESCPFVESGLESRSHEGVFTKKDGVQFAVLKMVTRISLDGKDYLLETFADISEQKRLEELKEDMDRIMRHDLRSPVTSVINAANISLLDDEVQGETRAMFETIKSQGKKILDMISLSMTLYRIEAGVFEYEPETIDVVELAREIVVELREMIQRTGVSVDIVFDGVPHEKDVSFIMPGDRLLLRSLLANLLINSVEASKRGQVVSLNVESGEEVMMTFTNSGVVPRAVRDTFFNKYATAGKTTGTGLGTYSARLVARNMGGDIEMETLDDENRTTVTVRLPADKG